MREGGVVRIACRLVSGLAAGWLLLASLQRTSAAVELVSISIDGTPGNHESWGPYVSSDGRFVAFSSHADNLVAGDTNSSSDAFVRDIVARSTERVSVAADGAQTADS
jgi:hypothetical protein